MPEESTSHKSLYYFIAILIIFGFLLHLSFFVAPKNFPVGKYIEIDKGLTIDGAALYLKENGVIKSPVMFRIFIKFFGKSNNVIAGEYKFTKPLSMPDVVMNVTDTEYQGRSVKITFPEGLTVEEMSELIGDKFINFNAVGFLSKAKPKEGYLFPDTYIFPITYSVDDVITRMTGTLHTKMDPLRDEIIKSKYTLPQVVIMASILEREARTSETMKMISGILWKRFDRGMALQVDAPFAYLLNRGTSEITVDDLKMDSPYNTYRYKGLPPTPISNPGVNALTAAVHPTESKYLFYLSDRDGNMHYTVTFDEHKKNKIKYLTK